MHKNVAIVFGRPRETPDPLTYMGEKRPVYEDLLMLFQAEGWRPVMVTTQSYSGNGVFAGYWQLVKPGKVVKHTEKIKIDLAYDRSPDKTFPVHGEKIIVTDNLDFKRLAWDKWKAYQEIGKYMPKSYLVQNTRDLEIYLKKIRTNFLVLKPVNGLKGKGIYIGPANGLSEFHADFTKRKYILQEFVETGCGIPGITSGRHDLRVVIVNGKIVWSHVRTPGEGALTANVAAGGTLKEIPIERIPNKVKNISVEVAGEFIRKYDNPIYSLDFGMENAVNPYLYELNDQIGFPKEEMVAKEIFIKEMVNNFKNKIDNA